MDDLGDRSKDPSPNVGNEKRESRRDFLKKGVVLGLAVPAAGALVRPAAARPSISIRDRSRSQFEGVTLQFAKAPFGTDEKDVIAKLLKPFEAKTGIKINHTIVPWATEGAAYATNYAGPNPYDVSYQTSTDLTGLGTKGVLEVLNNKKWMYSPAYKRRREVHSEHDQEEHLSGEALRVAVHHRRHRRVLQRICSRSLASQGPDQLGPTRRCGSEGRSCRW